MRVEGLRVAHRGRTVLDIASAELAPGRVTAVLGANGAGKSTLLRTMGALVPVRSGRVVLDGANVAAMSRQARAKAIGYLPQGGAVHWNIRVHDLVSLGRLPHGDRDEAPVAAALAATNTAALADRAVSELSGGERARVLLARVLAGEPRWLLADEPLASLDPLHQLETLALLRAAAARGVGVVVVLHDLTLAAQVADDVLLLKDGRPLAAGPADQVITGPNLAAAYGVSVAIVEQDGTRAIVPVIRT